MQWKNLSDIKQLEEADKISFTKKVLLFKHSTRCSISSTALNRLERNWKEEFKEKLEIYYLDLLNHRDISNAIEQRYGILHQSPQAIIIRNGKCTFSQTHSSINLKDLLDA